MNDVTHSLIGSCDVFRAFVETLDRIAASDATVLIRGGSGSGKGLAARALHAASPRAEGPFVTVDLAALAPSLVEAELFGHEVGAFTGAHRARTGRLRRAHGGTLVLDDIDTLPLDVQGKLVRVLQERIVEPVGAEVGEAVDLRLIVTTQRDLRVAVDAGQFRSDLYFRLAVVPIDVPPLRARLEDLPLLVEGLVERISATRRVQAKPLTPAALARLAEHAWPGNVRELENALERVLVLATGTDDEAIDAPALDFLDEANLGVPGEVAERALAHGMTLADLEHSLLLAALRQQGGNVSAAARQVGLTRRAFEYRLERSPKQTAEDSPKPRESA